MQMFKCCYKHFNRPIKARRGLKRTWLAGRASHDVSRALQGASSTSQSSLSSTRWLHHHVPLASGWREGRQGGTKELRSDGDTRGPEAHLAVWLTTHANTHGRTRGHTDAHAHTRVHARARTHTHTHTHTLQIQLYFWIVFELYFIIDNILTFFVTHIECALCMKCAV